MEISDEISRVSFAKFVLSGEPGFDVKLADVGSAHVTGANGDDLVGDFQSLHEMFLDGDEQFLFVGAGFGSGKNFHFDFVELVDAEDAFHVFASRTSFASESG